MAKKQINPIVILIIIAIGLFIFFNIDLREQIQSSILPELDNRLNYVDKHTDMTEFVDIGISDSPPYTEVGDGKWENDKFFLNIPETHSPSTYFEKPIRNGEDWFRLVTGGRIGGARLIVKKDFSRLNTFFRVMAQGGGFSLDNNVFMPDKGNLVGNEITNIEIQYDSVNSRYDIFHNGEFKTRIADDGKLDIDFFSSSTINGYFDWDYIKYVPPESFTIKNDEVWVKEVRTGGNQGATYNINNLDWEMIGFHSQIRPATRRDLIVETEVPTPQIYVNLINGLDVQIPSNNVDTFYYRTKWTQGLDSSCQGDLDKANTLQPDGTWKCESFVKETPIIQQCQTKADCPILPECENLRDTITCTAQKTCDYSLTSPQCKNQLITFQEKVTEIEKTKFVPIPSGANQFFASFDKTKTSYDIGEKKISISAPSYICNLPNEGGFITGNNDCWQTTLFFDGKPYLFKNNEEKTIYTLPDGKNVIKVQLSLGATLQINEEFDEIKKIFVVTSSEIKDWSAVAKVTLPDDFLEIKGKSLGNKFILQNSNDPITFTITNKLGFGINGGYTIQTQNLALEGGAVLRQETKELFLKNVDNDITYNFKTEEIGSILDIISKFGKVTTDRDYIMKSSQEGKEKFLAITKEVVTEIPQDIEKINAISEIIEEIPKEISKTEQIIKEKTEIPLAIKIIVGLMGLFVLLKLLRII